MSSDPICNVEYEMFAKVKIYEKLEHFAKVYHGWSGIMPQMLKALNGNKS